MLFLCTPFYCLNFRKRNRQLNCPQQEGYGGRFVWLAAGNRQPYSFYVLSRYQTVPRFLIAGELQNIFGSWGWMNMYSKVSNKTALIPKHETKRLHIFNEIAMREMMNSGADGRMRLEAKTVLQQLNIVYLPSCPKGIAKATREKIEKEARCKVRNRYRPKPEYYQIPSWIKKDALYKKYFLECLDAEIMLRKGYKERTACH